MNTHNIVMTIHGLSFGPINLFSFHFSQTGLSTGPQISLQSQLLALPMANVSFCLKWSLLLRGALSNQLPLHFSTQMPTSQGSHLYKKSFPSLKHTFSYANMGFQDRSGFEMELRIGYISMGKLNS